MTTNYKLACAISAALTGYAGAGYAADTSAAATASSESSGLAEIVVTAQRRTESIQDVPITIQALSGEQLKDLLFAPADLGGHNFGVLMSSLVVNVTRTDRVHGNTLARRFQCQRSG